MHVFSMKLIPCVIPISAPVCSVIRGHISFGVTCNKSDAHVHQAPRRPCSLLHCRSLVPVPPQDERSSVESDPEVVYVREPTPEQAALARELLLPLTFFCYQNEPGYISDDQPDGEKPCGAGIFRPRPHLFGGGLPPPFLVRP